MSASERRALTFSIYNFGTCYDAHSHDLIAELASRTDWPRLLNPGPGSADMARILQRPSRHGFDVAQVVAETLAGSPNPDDSGVQVLKHAIAWTMGALAGFGIKDRVDTSISTLLKMKTKPDRINIAAWSRGCITAILIANRLFSMAEFSRSELNLFLIDPVPGPLVLNLFNWWSARKRCLPVQTRGALLLYQENVIEGFFGLAMTAVPQEVVFEKLQRSALGTHALNENFRAISLPGIHSSAVEAAATDGSHPEFGPVASLARRLCEDFLLRHGTVIRGGRTIGDTELCELYAAVRLSIRHTNKTLLTKALDKAEVRAPRKPDSSAGTFFVNSHHVEVFGRKFKSVAELLKGNSRSDLPNIGAELENMRRHAPKSWQLYQEVLNAPPPQLGRLAANLRSSVARPGW